MEGEEERGRRVEEKVKYGMEVYKKGVTQTQAKRCVVGRKVCRMKEYV